jgi:hypothetical protein
MYNLLSLDNPTETLKTNSSSTRSEEKKYDLFEINHSPSLFEKLLKLAQVVQKR